MKRPTVIENRVFRARSFDGVSVRMVLKRNGDTIFWADDGVCWPGTDWDHPPISMRCSVESFAGAVFIDEYMDDPERCRKTLHNTAEGFLEFYRARCEKDGVPDFMPDVTVKDVETFMVCMSV